MNQKQLAELLAQSLEHAKGAALIYATALKCAVNGDLRGEWDRHLNAAQEQVRALTEVCAAMGLDPEAASPGRAILRDMGNALVAAMECALSASSPEDAQLIACECVALAEAKGSVNWSLLDKCADHIAGRGGKALRAACEEAGERKEVHFREARDWSRELWLASLKMDAMLPPSRERRSRNFRRGRAGAHQEVRSKSAQPALRRPFP